MKNTFGSVMFIIGLGLLYDVFKSSKDLWSWGGFIAFGLTLWGLEMLITQFTEEANKKSSSELKSEIETLRNDIKSKEQDDFTSFISVFLFEFRILAEGGGLEPPRAFARLFSRQVHYHSANPPLSELT